ncbi:4'-phosphopantetheinyl transferase superfamily protein [Streptomyces sp. NPDC050636]|uniref:4'-phosphopantetheinyl transferase family protein n=1 Tax=Streptomyces sp. NPDC050636 TaxID=3154510 RepID=UPI00341EDC60
MPTEEVTTRRNGALRAGHGDGLRAGQGDDLWTGAATHIWQGQVADQLGPEDLALLSREERARYEQLRPAAGAHYAGIHAGLRRLLAEYLDVAPADIRIGPARCPGCGAHDHGPPHILWPHTELVFSLSRSGPHWLVGVTLGPRRIGVDIETVRNIVVEEVAPAAFSPAELAVLYGESDVSARTAMFYRAWTRKEAVVKASGVGIVAGLRNVEVLGTASGPTRVHHQAHPESPAEWCVQDLFPESESSRNRWFAAVAQDIENMSRICFRAR